MTRPLAIDLCCGLGGWTDGLLAEGYDVIGFDIERHVYGDNRYPAQLVLQNILTLHGSQFRDASLIVASPPCQEFSYMAMPWQRAKQKARDYESGVLDVRDLTRLFDTCFSLQREACHAAGRHIPLVVENVRGAEKWVGRARWNFGSYYLWGDVPALMPVIKRAAKVPGMSWSNSDTGADKRLREDHRKVGDQNQYRKTDGKQPSPRFTNPEEGRKSCGWFGKDNPSAMRQHNSKSSNRKRASAMIAKIPLALSSYIARIYKPRAAA